MKVLLTIAALFLMLEYSAQSKQEKKDLKIARTALSVGNYSEAKLFMQN